MSLRTTPNTSLSASSQLVEGATGPLGGRRILVIMPSIPLQGMERANLQIIRMLKDQGADLLCVTERDYGQVVVQQLEQIGCPWTPAPGLTRLHLCRNPLELWRMLQGWWQTAACVRRIIAKYKPTHIHVTNLTFFLLSWPALQGARLPVIFRLPNPPDRGLAGYKQRISDAIWRLLVFPTADVLVANCEFTVEELRKTGLNGQNVAVIRNCLPRRKSKVGPSDAPQVRQDRFNLAFTSQIRASKGADLAVEAAERLIRDDWPVDLYLAGENGWRNPFADELKHRVTERGLADRIRFLGHIDDVFGLLERCDLHLQPSRVEVFPNSVLEAKALGLPSVVFDSGGLTEMIDHLTNGFVCCEKSAHALYEGIRYFLDAPDVLQAASRAARESLKRYSEQEVSHMWADLYRSLR